MDAVYWTDLTIRLAKAPALRTEVRRYLDALYPHAPVPRQNGKASSPSKLRPSADDLLAEIQDWEEQHLQVVERGVRERLRQRRPSVSEYIRNVPELHNVAGMTSWTALASHLGIQVGKDSARRKVAAWVQNSRPNWPPLELV